jgi:predicted RNase H-like HicB family nuclease
MSKINLKAAIWKEDEYYISQCLDVNVCSFGKTKKEALAMLQDALKLYFEDTPVPQKTKRIKYPSIESISFQHA